MWNNAPVVRFAYKQVDKSWHTWMNIPPPPQPLKQCWRIRKNETPCCNLPFSKGDSRRGVGLGYIGRILTDLKNSARNRHLLRFSRKLNNHFVPWDNIIVIIRDLMRQSPLQPAGPPWQLLLAHRASQLCEPAPDLQQQLACRQRRKKAPPQICQNLPWTTDPPSNQRKIRGSIIHYSVDVHWVHWSQNTVQHGWIFMCQNLSPLLLKGDKIDTWKHGTAILQYFSV